MSGGYECRDGAGWDEHRNDTIVLKKGLESDVSVASHNFFLLKILIIHDKRGSCAKTRLDVDNKVQKAFPSGLNCLGVQIGKRVRRGDWADHFTDILVPFLNIGRLKDVHSEFQRGKERAQWWRRGWRQRWVYGLLVDLKQ